MVSLDSKFAPPHVVDRALALERVEAPDDSRVVFGARLDPELWVADVGPWGGYVAALLTKAIGEAVPELPAVSLTVHFLSRLRVGDAQVTVEVEARGSRVGHVVARITQEDRTGAIALATLGRNPQDDFVSDFARPAAPPPEEVLRRAESSHPYMQHLDIRPTVVVRPWSGDNEGTLAGWIRLVDPRPLDLPLLAALPDGWMPGTWARLRNRAGKVTVEMTTYFRANIAPEDDGWWFLRIRTRHVERGFADEECEVWGSDGASWPSRANSYSSRDREPPNSPTKSVGLLEARAAAYRFPAGLSANAAPCAALFGVRVVRRRRTTRWLAGTPLLRLVSSPSRSHRRAAVCPRYDIRGPG